MFQRIFNRRSLPWFLTVILAAAFAAVLLKPKESANGSVINGVVQDTSGRIVTVWVDPMYAQGPPHTTRSNKPGKALDCGMTLVPIYADELPAKSVSPSSVSGYSNVSLPFERRQMIGVKLGKAEIRSLSHVVRTNGTVAIDETQQAQITTKFDGFIEHLFVDYTGAPVRRGQPLLSVYSPDLLATQQDLILASKNRAQFGGALYESARRRLLLWDMSADDIDAIVRSGQPRHSVILRSPVDGVVITRSAVEGRRVMPGDVLYELANLHDVWVMADIYESDLPLVRVGESARVRLAYFPGRSWSGRVSFVPPVVDPVTRTAKVRIELPNPDGVLRPAMFADVELQETIGATLTVPESAVMQTGTRSVVFVESGEGEFEPREVTTGIRAGGLYQILSGLAAGDSVVAEANFLVDSESRLKAKLETRN